MDAICVHLACMSSLRSCVQVKILKRRAPKSAGGGKSASAHGAPLSPSERLIVNDGMKSKLVRIVVNSYQGKLTRKDVDVRVCGCVKRTKCNAVRVQLPCCTGGTLMMAVRSKCTHTTSIGVVRCTCSSQQALRAPSCAVVCVVVDGAGHKPTGAT